MTSKEKYTFTLDGFDFKEIIQNFLTPSNETTSEIILDYTTSAELIQNNYVRNCTMCEFSGNELNGILPLQTDKCCWWCRHKFTTFPIGPPLHYYPHNDKNPMNINVQKYFEQKNIIFETNEFFETEGIFCSFECCKAYLIDNNNKTIYSRSLTLLTLLFQKIMGYNPENIEPASSWKILKNYGGGMEIEEFRKSFGKNDLTINIKRPYQFIIGHYFENIK